MKTRIASCTIILVQVFVRTPEQFSKKCGLSQSEYVRKRALGYEPNTALPDAFFTVYQMLCDVANQAEMNGFEKTLEELNNLIDYTHRRLIAPSQFTAREIEEELAKWL